MAPRGQFSMARETKTPAEAGARVGQVMSRQSDHQSRQNGGLNKKPDHVGGRG